MKRILEVKSDRFGKYGKKIKSTVDKVVDKISPKKKPAPKKK